MDEVEALGMQLDRASATLLVSKDGERHFLAATTLAAVALYLLKKYADGYLKGLGLDAAATRHGEKTRALLTQLRSGPDLLLDKARFDFDESVRTLREHGPDAKAQGAARDALVEAFVDAGAVRLQAEGEAAKVMAVADAMIGR
jgi:hypothetical protein